MKGERYRPPVPEQWREEILEDVERIKTIPEPVLKRGPIYETRTKMGKVLQCETYEIDLEEARKAENEGIPGLNIGNQRLYLIAKDSSDHVVGIRTTSLFHLQNKIDARSIIKVIHKGGGYATPIDEAFQQQLQDIANRHQMPVVWYVTNQNLERLEEYRTERSVNKQILRNMEQEQERWQALYGDGGKFGIVKGKKTFTPTTKQ
ncbi:hypothetical protein COV05_00860 [Candidatus Uhrbacteria bacterium CG10_big_fil_rev_8_21_14_0_10_48_16]|uniref:Uncharacterized protein n=1 Tax=Candidatus Uhrbacteria bacterium CG10_big_fil_rev_8_21_14_0_10_48_16 TaxID=1975038 RepID=A0A2M8LIB7_9BACT|nr:MAG: hypothetical protein COV05_00860 [Candidatus Uhrbacteria bacterium CG10_big_fil_rev_8_21_14_0_10_48_16]